MADTLTSPAGITHAGQARWLHLIPVIFLLYTIAFFDRVNIGMALPSMAADLHLSPSQQGFVGGVFFWGYLPGFLLGGWLALRFGAKRVVLTSLLAWGLFSMATGLARNLPEVTALRLLLGFAEGPLWTSLALLLSQWFLKSERGRAFGLWNLSIPVGAILSGPLSGLVLQYSDWHWMFLIGGAPAWLWAFVWWRNIPVDLDHAHWLPAEERRRLEEGLAIEHAEFATKPAETSNWGVVLHQPAVWLLLGATCLNNMIFYGFGLWLPTVLKASSALNIGSVGLLNALPYVAAGVGLVWCTRSSDRRKERRLHAGIPMIVGGVLLYLGSQADWGIMQMLLFILVGATMYMTLPLISTLVTDILPSEQAILAISLIGGVGNLFGGFVGPQLVGSINQMTGNFTLAFALIGLFGVIGGVLILVVRPPRRAAL
ncbi:MAG: MFS transporter [Acetobacteraceae bacterium]|nr:MFS transporter [Acetobacteraceae bacterium]